MNLGKYLLGYKEGVWVSHRKGIVCVKNPRTASTAFLKQIRGICPDMRCAGNTPELCGWLGDVSDEILEGYWIFTTARNTWERLVSAYCWLKNDLGGCGFDDFIGMIADGSLSGRALYYVKPQVGYFMLGDRVFADYVGRFEYMDLACRRVMERCGEWDGTMSVYNSTKHSPFCEYYTYETAKVVYDIYQRDISILGCRIDGFDIVPPMEWLRI